jgi:endonuclease/exonuclease/phosphatase family metal-dependent hydrolase
MAMLRPVIAVLVLALSGPAAAANERLRIATFNTELSREGPGVLLGELINKPRERALAVARIIRTVRPDVLVVQGIDHDLHGLALDAFAALLAEGEDGIDYAHRFHAPVNAGRPSGLDLDGDGFGLGRGDALAWGRYPGEGGMAILSRLPIDAVAARTFRDLRWRDLPGATLPLHPDGTAHFAPEAEAVLPLSTRSHWDVPVVLPGGGRLHLLTAHPTPPLFDGPERMNVLRNRDELRFWLAYLDGAAVTDDAGRSAGASAEPLVLLGDFNLDPFDGAGERGAVAALLAHPRLQDPAPASAGGTDAARRQGGTNDVHHGDAAVDTADWRDAPGPGNLRVDYVLPDRRLAVLASGVFWPGPGDAHAGMLEDGPAHRLVWVDVALR